MTDEQFNTWIREHAAEYHAPPPIPAEAMWGRIAGDIDRAVTANAAPRLFVGGRARRSATTHVSRWIGAAAFAATLCVGVVIGQWNARRSMMPIPIPTSPAAPAHASTVAAAPAPTRSHGGNRTLSPRALPRAAHTMVAALGHAASPAVLPNDDIQDRDPGSVYTVTANQHLANAEALLTAFQTDARVGRVDPQLARWARDLLATTRVLYDAPATRDPQLKALLGDLELVLVQLATYQPGRKADARLATRAVTQSAIIPRLREVSNL